VQLIEIEIFLKIVSNHTNILVLLMLGYSYKYKYTYTSTIRYPISTKPLAILIRDEDFYTANSHGIKNKKFTN